MPKENFFKRFVEWQNYAHYLLNALFLFLEVLMFKLYGLGNLAMFFIVAGLLFVNESIIHAIFWFLPEKLRWRD